jgi:oligopeptide/dipeptide ABC transporter ATP-binding protein
MNMLKENMVLLKGQGLKQYFEVNSPFGIGKRKLLRAIDGVDIEIFDRETLGLAGESGCGKSTLGRVLLRLIQPTEGRIFFLDNDITEMPEKKLRDLRRYLQIILQNPFASLNPRLRVSRSAGEGLEVHKICSKSEIKEILIEMFIRVGLKKEYLDKYPHELSGGERQRVCIARALVLKPKVIVADEPVSALDVTIQSQIIDLLLGLQDEFALSYLFITHDLRILRRIAHRTAIMYLGKIVEFGTTEEIFKNPLHPYTEILLNSIPPAHPQEKRRQIKITGEVPSATDIPSGCRFRTRCPYAFKRCSEEMPELKEVTTHHWAACFLR